MAYPTPTWKSKRMWPRRVHCDDTNYKVHWNKCSRSSLMGFWNITYTFQGNMSSKPNELRSISRLRTVILLKSDFWLYLGLTVRRVGGGVELPRGQTCWKSIIKRVFGPLKPPKRVLIHLGRHRDPWDHFWKSVKKRSFFDGYRPYWD